MIAVAAFVPVADELKGRVPEIYVALKPGVAPSAEIQKKVVTAIETQIGKIARPKTVWIVPDMPKTRSGKIMRRVVRAVAEGRSEVGDVSTLEDGASVEEVRRAAAELAGELRRNPG